MSNQQRSNKEINGGNRETFGHVRPRSYNKSSNKGSATGSNKPFKREAMRSPKGHREIINDIDDVDL